MRCGGAPGLRLGEQLPSLPGGALRAVRVSWRRYAAGRSVSAGRSVHRRLGACFDSYLLRSRWRVVATLDVGLVALVDLLGYSGAFGPPRGRASFRSRLALSS